MYMMDEEFEKIYKKLSLYIHKKKSLEMIKKAYEYVKKAFDGIYRKDGNPYIKHLLETAEIVVDLTACPETITAALLHDSIEDIESITREEIALEFGEDVASLVEAVTKISNQEKDSRNKTVQKLFSLMRDDVRVIVIKLADRLNNMRTLNAMPKDKQERIARQTLELYAPVSRYLGLNEIAKELEELCLFYLDRNNYERIANYVESHTKKSKSAVEMMKKNLALALKSVNIESRIYSTNKEMYKIYKYLNNYGNLEGIDDLNVIHIIVEDNLDCYLALGVVHAIYTPLIGKLKDYISSPKYNMYQALHTVVIGPGGNSVKIAIATNVMDRLFNEGISSMWKYDEAKGYSKEKEQEDIRKHLNIIKELDRINMVNGVDSNTYVKILEEDVFNLNQYIYVYTTRGEVIVLANGSTALDFAFKINSETAMKVNKIIINGLECTLATPLKNGAIVKVTYSRNLTIKEDWLNFVNSNYAKVKIKEHFKK